MGRPGNVAARGERLGGCLRARLFAIATGLLIATMVVTAASAAADADGACEPTRVQAWPFCSPETIDAVSSPLMQPLPHFKSRTFSRVFKAPPPGRARMKLSGVVNAGGVSCASHVAAVMGDADFLRGSPGQRSEKLREYTQKGLAGAAVPHRVVFHI